MSLPPAAAPAAATKADSSPTAHGAATDKLAGCSVSTGSFSSSCSSAASFTPSRVPPSPGDQPSRTVSSLSEKQQSSISVLHLSLSAFRVPPALAVLCAAFLSSCLGLFFYPSFVRCLSATTLATSPVVERFSELFHYYCVRPTAGADAARALAAPILVLSALYLPAIFLLQRWMRDRTAFHLKTACVVWNLLLSCLSFVGFLVMLFSQPSLLVRPVLPEPEFTPAVRAVICIFTLSKAVEYGDTVLLALRKKPLIFLHLYHHITVTLYCWHAQLVRISVGHYFAVINLGIHAWMYLYYTLAALFPRHPLLRSWRPLITVSQILQMCVGLSLAAYALTQGLPVEEHFNAAVAVVMYVSYACLFVHFFFNAYVRRRSHHPAPKRSPSSFFSTSLQLLILIHLLAAAGLYLLLTHKRRNTLLLEILSVSAATAAVLPLVVRSQYSKTSCSSIKTGAGGSQKCCLTATTPSYTTSGCSRGSSTYSSSSFQAYSSRQGDTQNNSFCRSRRTGSITSTAKEEDIGVTYQVGSSVSNLKTQSCSSSSNWPRLVGDAAAGYAATLAPSRNAGRTPAAPQETPLGSEQLQQRFTKVETLQSCDSPTLKMKAAGCVQLEAAASPAFCSGAVSATDNKERAVAGAASAYGCAGEAKPEQEPQQHLREASSQIAAASYSPPLGVEPQQSSSSDSTGRSTKNTESCSLPTAGGGAGTVAAQQERLLSQSKTAAADQLGDCSSPDKEGRKAITFFEAVKNIVSRVILNSTVLSSNSSSHRLPKISTSCEASRAALSAAAVAGRQAQSGRFVAVAQATLQGGGQTLLTISNFLLACALKRFLVDLPEAAAAAGRTAAHVSRSSEDAAAEAAAPPVEDRKRDVDGSAEEAAAAAWGDDKKKQQQQAATEQQQTLGAAQHSRRSDFETENPTSNVWEGCCRSSVLLLGTQLAQQQRVATPGERQVGEGKQQHQQESHAEMFCEENSSTVCSSPENLSGGLCSAATAASGGTPAAATESQSSMGLAEGGGEGATAATACETSTAAGAAAKTCFPFNAPPFNRATVAAAGKREAKGDATRQLHEDTENKSSGNVEALLRSDVAGAAQPCLSLLPRAAAAAAAREDAAGTGAGGTGRHGASSVAQQQWQQMEDLQRQQQEGRTGEKQQQMQEMPGARRDSARSAVTPVQSSSEGLQVFRWRSQEEVKRTRASASARELLLAATCAGLPAFYGWMIHENALLGLCVHGALRWLLELYTSCTLYRSSRRLPVAAARRGSASGGERIVRQECS